jgi:hypothetical protein
MQKYCYHLITPLTKTLVDVGGKFRLAFQLLSLKNKQVLYLLLSIKCLVALSTCRIISEGRPSLMVMERTLYCFRGIIIDNRNLA